MVFRFSFPKFPRRKKFFDLRDEKTHKKTVEEKTTTKSKVKNLPDFPRRKKYPILEGKKCYWFCEEKKLLEKTREKNYLGCL